MILQQLKQEAREELGVRALMPITPPSGATYDDGWRDAWLDMGTALDTLIDKVVDAVEESVVPALDEHCSYDDPNTTVEIVDGHRCAKLKALEAFRNFRGV